MLDIIIVISYLILCLFVGLAKTKKIKNIREYTLGKGNISPIFLAATIFATSVSSSSTIGRIGIIYQYGLIYALPSILLFIYWIITAKLLSKILDKFKNCLSLSDIMKKLYGKVGAWSTNILVIMDSIGFVTIQWTAIGYLANSFFNINYEVGVVLGCIVITLYSVVGGIRSVVFTDFLQFLIFCVGFPLICGLIYSDVGKIQGIIEQVPSAHLRLGSNKEEFLIFLSYLFYCLLPTVSAPNIQRMLIAKQPIKIEQSFYLVSIFAFIFNIVLVVLAFSLRVKYNNIPADQIFFHFINNYLSIGLKGIIISALLAIMMSTADSWLNVSSSILAHGIYKKFSNIIKNEVFLARLCTVAIAIIALCISLKIQKILSVIWFVRNFFQPIIFFPFIAGVLGVKVKKQYFIFSAIAGILGVLLARYIIGEFGLGTLMFGTISSGSTLFILILYGRKKGLFKTKEYINNIFSDINEWKNNVYKRIRNRVASEFIESIYNLDKKLSVLSLYIIISSIPLFIMFNVNIRQVSPVIILQLLLVIISGTYIFLNKKLEEKDKIKIYYMLCTMLFIILRVLCVCIEKQKLLVSFNLLISFFILILLMKIAIAFTLSLIGSSIGYGIYCSILTKKDIILSLGVETEIYLSITTFLLFLYLFIQKQGEKDKKMAATLAANSIVTHDLRGPIALLKSYVYVLKYYKIKDSKIIELVNKIDFAVNNSSEIVESFLPSLKEDHRITLEERRINDIMNNVLENPAYRDLSIEIQVDLKENFIVRVDDLMIKQVLNNLLNNAIEATLKSSKKIIYVSTLFYKKRGLLTIKDTGCGIESRDIDKIFDPFFSKKNEGYGIGLAFCKHTLEKMHISIECKSKWKKETEFKLSFPL